MCIRCWAARIARSVSTAFLFLRRVPQEDVMFSVPVVLSKFNTEYMRASERVIHFTSDRRMERDQTNRQVFRCTSRAKNNGATSKDFLRRYEPVRTDLRPDVHGTYSTMWGAKAVVQIMGARWIVIFSQAGGVFCVAPYGRCPANPISTLHLATHQFHKRHRRSSIESPTCFTWVIGSVVARPATGKYANDRGSLVQ